MPTDPDTRTLTIPFHKDFLAKIQARKDEEFEKLKQPVSDEAYVHSIVLNWFLNMEMQQLGEQAQKDLQRQLRTEIQIYSNANQKALQK